jgi:hypothetical protein
MKSTLIPKISAALLLFLLIHSVRAQDASEQKPAHADKNSEVHSLASAPRFSPGVQEVLRMVESGVSAGVIQTYIGQSTNAIYLSAADLVALKEKSIPDEITIALLKRGAELAAHPQSQGKARVEIPVRLAQEPGQQVYPDPESYAYFQYYYFYPRTLASVNERLLSSYYWGFPGASFYGGARGFHPHH